MKRIILSLSILSLCLFAAPAQAVNLGIDGVHKAGQKAGFEKATETTFAETLGSVINTALSFVGVIFTALMVYAGYLWMMARGEESQIEKAQNIIRGAIIGIIITLAAYSISNFIVDRVLDKVSAPSAPAAQVK